LKGLERDFSPLRSWCHALEGNASARSGRIVWAGEVGGNTVSLTDEPGRGLGRGIECWFYSILPGLEGYL
jgi:hypothetical protein